MKTKLSIIIFLISLSHLAFGQSPDCHFDISIRKVNSELYDYKFILLNEPEKPNFQDIKKSIEIYGWDRNMYALNFSGRERSFYLKSEKGNTLFVDSWLLNYVVPNDRPLTVIAIRKKKKTGKIDLMYADIANPRCGMKIEFSKFKKGKRKSETFIYIKDSSNYNNISIIK